MKKIIVWDLFGGGNNSIRKALDNNKYEVYTFDILQGFNLLNYEFLENYPKPDIIVASPPCESFSIADCAGSIWDRKTMTMRDENYYIEYNKNANPNKRRNYLKKKESAEIGLKLIKNTCEIIKIYQPKFWYIENPQSSLIWNFIEIDGIKNLAWYGSYDLSFSKKPTIFYSNVKMELKKEKCNWNKEHCRRNSYKLRSAIPASLINEIFNKIQGENNEKKI